MQAIAFETDAYAIMDTLGYIRPKVYTLVIGQAFGNAAMVVASGVHVPIAALLHLDFYLDFDTVRSAPGLCLGAQCPGLLA